MTRQIEVPPCDDPHMSTDGNRVDPARLGATLLAIALFAPGCGGGDDVSTAMAGSDGGETTTVATTTDPPPAPNEGDGAGTVSESESDSAAGDDADGPAATGSDSNGEAADVEPMDLPADGFERQAEPGTYHLGATGLPEVTFEIGDGWSITNVAGAGENSPFGDFTVRVSDRAWDLGRRDLHISRPTHLLDPSFIGPARPVVVAADVDLWDVADIRRWLAEAEAAGEWGVIDVVDTEVSGYSAVGFTLQPDFVGCEGMEAEAEGIRGEWTGCNGGIAWDMDTDPEGGGRLSVEGWDGGQSEYLWIDDVDGKPLVVGLQFGYDIDEEWAARARAVVDSLAIG